MLKNKDLLGLKDTPKEEIQLILDVAEEMKKIVRSPHKKSPYFAGKSMATLFYENSTRTKSSFEFACSYMGGVYSSLNVATSSVNKGESILDTLKTIDSFGTDVIVIRHSMSGVPHVYAPHVRAHIVNAGDGLNEHPTQALLDMLTMRERYDTFRGLKVAILGDVKHSRVARSNVWGLSKMGAEIRICGPGTLLPSGVEKLPGVTVCATVEEAVRDADVVMGLRLQLERMTKGLIPSMGEYHRYFGVDEDMLAKAKKGALLLHPGPVNRNVELSFDVVDCRQSMINEQVTNGVAVRMAVMYLLTRDNKVV
ncbi:MAG TPA: aspartate carbamoyltransferase catalytic subunit [Firmicutes bacterium]|nr:aspartate carbamoyltransferase catalytic subunit [Bacillota bacterium]